MTVVLLLVASCCRNKNYAHLHLTHALGSQLQTMTKEYFSGGVNTFTRILHDVKLNFQFAKLPIKDAAKLVFKKIIRHIICRDE